MTYSIGISHLHKKQVALLWRFAVLTTFVYAMYPRKLSAGAFSIHVRFHFFEIFITAYWPLIYEQWAFSEFPRQRFFSISNICSLLIFLCRATFRSLMVVSVISRKEYESVGYVNTVIPYSLCLSVSLLEATWNGNCHSDSRSTDSQKGSDGAQLLLTHG